MHAARNAQAKVALPFYNLARLYPRADVNRFFVLASQ